MKGNVIRLLLWFVGVALGGTLIYLLYRQSDPMAILRNGFFTSFCLSTVLIFGGKKRRVFAFLMSLLVLSIILISIRLTVFQFIFYFSVMLSIVLLAPFLLILFVNRIRMKEMYKKTIYASFIPILLILVFGRWGNAIQTTIVVSISIPLFYSITKEASSKERWVCYCIFTGVYVLFSLVCGSFEYLVFPIVAFVSVLFVVFLLSTLLTQRKSRWLMLFLMVVSGAVSYYGSLNSFYFFSVRKEGQVEQMGSISYKLIVNEGDTLTEESSRGKNVVIFFWSSHCASCHIDMPSFSDLAAEYKFDTTKLFVAAFITFEADDQLYYQRESERKYDFVFAKVHHGQKLMKELGFNSFPHLTILNKEGQIVYNGMYIGRKGVFVYNPRKYINL